MALCPAILFNVKSHGDASPTFYKDIQKYLEENRILKIEIDNAFILLYNKTSLQKDFCEPGLFATEALRHRDKRKNIKGEAIKR